MELYIRRGRLRQGAHETAALIDTHREWPTAKKQPLQTEFHLAEPGVQLVVGGDRFGAFVNQSDLQVILQIFADTGQMMPYRDAVRLQQRCGADAGELQQLRRLNRACRQQHFSFAMRGFLRAALRVVHTHHLLPFENQTSRMGTGFDAQV